MEKNRTNTILEEKIYNLIRDDDENSKAANIVDGILMAVVLASVVVSFVNTFDIPTHIGSILSGLELIFVILFTIEYLLRLWTAELMYPDLSPARARLRYVFTGMAIVDLLSILPYYLPMFGIGVGTFKTIRLVRFLRVFKINRYTSALSLIGRVLKTRATQLLSSIIVIVVLIFIASMLMFDVEHAAQPDKFNNALSAMWWAMSTITTVGYGDIYPITSLGRILSALITFLGIGLTAIPTGIISAGFIEQSRIANVKNKENHSDSDECFCSKCGQKLPEVHQES